MESILLIEDDVDYGNIITGFLTKAGYTVDFVDNSVEGVQKITDNEYDLIISDLMLEKFSGFQILEIMKLDNKKAKFIIMTGSISDEDELRGLQFGIDDYLRKSNSFSIMLQRIENVLKRPRTIVDEPEKIESRSEQIIVDLTNNDVFKNGELVYLSALEYELLVFFLRNKNTALSREAILRAVWGLENESSLVDDRTIDTHVKKIRKKLSVDSIFSVRGIGYRWYEKN